MSLLDLTPTLVFEFGRAAAYLMALVFGFLLHAKGRTPSLLCMLGGLLAVYAMLASRVICDAMWEAVRYDHTVAVAREVTFVVKLIGSAAEVLGLTLIVLAVFAGRKRGKAAPPAASQTTNIASP